MNSTLSSNLQLLANRFPTLAEKLCAAPLNNVMTTKAQDSGICYVKKGDDAKWYGLSNPNDPIRKAQIAVTDIEERIKKGLAPAVVIGLNPGYTLEILFNHFEENCYDKYIPRRIYVIIDSLECLYAWLRDKDRSKILNQEEIEFYWYKEVKRITRLCKKDEQRSHLFIPVTTLPEQRSMKLIEPLAEFFISRQEEEKALYEENCKYYQEQSDEEFDKIIRGEADRKPRLLIPSHASSTVVQYSVRDTAAMFAKEGWEVRIMHMKTDLSRWRINKNINDFKPDIYLQVNHLRTEDTEFYPPEMMYITWVQDTVSYINNSENAKAWNDHVGSKKKRRDLVIGYVGQIKEYGYKEDRLAECPMIVNKDIFKARELTPEEKTKYECDICFASNRSKETSLIVKEDLAPKLEKYGFTEDILMSIHDHLWEYYRDEKTCVGYIQLEDKIIELPDVCILIEKLVIKDDHGFVIQRIYWELNDVIYRHIVLEWIDEMGDQKLHLYGRGWENHPRFSKYAKGILSHGEELALAYQSAKQCLHLNSLEGDHQRLNEIIDAKGNPLTRLSLDKELLSRQQQILEGFEDLHKPNIHFINTLWNNAKNVLEKYPKSQFHNKLNEVFSKLIKNIKTKLKQKSISFSCKESLGKQNLSSEYVNKVTEKNNALYQNLLSAFSNGNNTNSREVILLSLTSFLFKLLEGKRKISLQEYPALQSNLFCKIVQLTSQEEKEKTYKTVKNKTSFDDLTPELIPTFINSKFNFGEEKEVETLIEKAYEKNNNLCDLYFQIAITMQKNDKNWLTLAKKDLERCRMSIKPACILSLYSTKTPIEKEISKTILKNVSSIQKCDRATFIDLLPLFSQSIKNLGLIGFRELTKNLSIKTPNKEISSATVAAFVENNIKHELKIGISPEYLYSLIILGETKRASQIFIKAPCTKTLIHYAQLAQFRSLKHVFSKIFYFLSVQNVEILQEQALEVIKNNSLNKNEIETFIKTSYKNNKKLRNLYSKYAQKSVPDCSSQIKLYWKDLQENRMSLIEAENASALLGTSKKDKQRLKFLLEKINTIIEIDSSNILSLIPIFSRAVKYLGAKNFKELFKNKILKSPNILLAKTIALLENGFPSAFDCNINKSLNETAIIYYNILTSSKSILNKPVSQNEIIALKHLANRALEKQLIQPATSIFQFLVSNKATLSKSQIYTFITHTKKDHIITTTIISNLYKANPHLVDLHVLCALKREMTRSSLIEYTTRDINLNKLTLKSAAIIIKKLTRSENNLIIKKIIANFENLIVTKDITFETLLTVFSSTLRNFGKKKLHSLKDKLKNELPNKLIYLAEKASLLENQFACAVILTNKTCEKHPTATAYISILLARNNTYSKPNELIHLANSAYQRKFETISIKVYEDLFRKDLLSPKATLKYARLLTDHSIPNALSLLNNISASDWTDEIEIETQWIRLLAGLPINLKKIEKSHDHSNIKLSVLYSETGYYKKTSPILPNPDDKRFLFLQAIMYLNSKSTDCAKLTLQKISTNVLTFVESQNEAMLSKIIENVFAPYRENPENLILKSYILSKLLNSPKILSSHPANCDFEKTF